MTKAKLLTKAGGVKALAALLGISRQAVYKWDEVPALQLYRLRELKPEWFPTVNSKSVRSRTLAKVRA